MRFKTLEGQPKVPFAQLLMPQRGGACFRRDDWPTGKYIKISKPSDDSVFSEPCAVVHGTENDDGPWAPSFLDTMSAFEQGLEVPDEDAGVS